MSNFFLKFTFNLWNSSRNFFIQIKLFIIKIYRSNIIYIISFAWIIFGRMMIIFIGSLTIKRTSSVIFALIYFGIGFPALLVFWWYLLDNTRTIQFILVLVVKRVILFLILREMILINNDFLFLLFKIIIGAHHVLKFRIACKVSYLLLIHAFFVLIFNKIEISISLFKRFSKYYNIT